MQKRVNRGFTLVELLVVIAIVSILASILFPVFARARENARRSSCASNLKQLAMGLMMYAQDNDGGLPAYSTPRADGTANATWAKLYLPTIDYVKNQQIYRCPSAPAHPFAITDYRAAQYGYTWGNGTPISWTGVKANYAGTSFLDAVPDPVRTCLLGEGWANSSSSTPGQGASQFRPTTSTWNGLRPDAHLEGANYAFVDGHVKWLKMETVAGAMTQGASGATRTTAPSLPIIFAWSSIS